MQTTPFKHITYHNDGGHKFTVAVGDHRKVFVANDAIPLRKAIDFAMKFRDSVARHSLGMSDVAKELGVIDKFVAELENPIMDKPVKTYTTKPAKPAPQRNVKVTVIPAPWESRDKKPVTTTTTSPQSKPVKHKPYKNKHFAKLVAPNRRYPSLPSGCNPVIYTQGKFKTLYLSLTVSFSMNGDRKNKTFYVGAKDKFSLQRYRMVRHVAMTFRKEYIKSVIDDVPFDPSDFDNWIEKIYAGTFKWPFTGTLPALKESAVKPLHTKVELAALDVLAYLGKHKATRDAISTLSDKDRDVMMNEMATLIRSKTFKRSN